MPRNSWRRTHPMSSSARCRATGRSARQQLAGRDRQREKIMRKMIAVAGLSLALAACQSPGGAAPGDIGVNKTTGGSLVGAGLGGLLGNQFGGGAGKGVVTLVGVL